MQHLIPHQLHLSPAQKRKLLSGLSVQISHAKMGAGAGSDILHLNGKNAKKILSAFKKVKGVRITLDPEEIGESGEGLYGSGVSRSKKAKKWTKYSVDTINDALGLAGKAKTMFGYGSSVGTALSVRAGRSPLSIGYGSRVKKAEKWEDFSVGAANDALGLASKAKNIFGYGVNRAKKAKKWTKYSVDTINDALGLAGKAKTMFGYGSHGPIGANSMKPRGIGGDGLYGYPAHSGSGLYGSGGGCGLYGSGLASVIRKRGRPRILGRGAATESKAFRTAMRINKQVVSDAPVVVKSLPSGRATINSRVRPSSSEMTLSPYQSMTSPAMNPYVPKNAYQNGGVDYNL